MDRPTRLRTLGQAAQGFTGYHVIPLIVFFGVGSS